MKRLAIAAALAAALSTSAFAQVTVKDPWVRATVPQQKATGAFMQLTSRRASRLVEARSSVAGVVEVHEMAMDGDVMKMRAGPGVDLPAGKAVDLKPGGYHVMLMDLKQPAQGRRDRAAHAGGRRQGRQARDARGEGAGAATERGGRQHHQALTAGGATGPAPSAPA